MGEPGALPEITGISDDSRSVSSGFLFCAVEGTVHDGHDFLPEAVERGAVAALVTRPIGSPIPQIVVSDGRAAASVAACEWHGCAARDLSVVGVTGTNGKTTTVSILRHLLNAEGTAGSLGTLGAFDGAGARLEGYGALTTPGTVELQAVLADLRNRGVEWVAMEASSHALDQRRLDNVPLRAAVYTNLTHEHLDYHADLEAYRDAKARLSTYLADGGVEVVNADDPAWGALPEMASVRRILFGTVPDAIVRASEIESDATGSHARFHFDELVLSAHVPFLGSFNVSNALAASAAAWAVGIDPPELVERLRSAPRVPGRMEQLRGDAFSVLRDYAHTPDALERVLRTLRPLTKGKLIVVFGAGGDRDRSKRPEMGRIASELADVAVITSDNPRMEDPDRIMNDIETGIRGGADMRIADRRDAIHAAIELLRPGDCLLLAGKGHENYQMVGEERLAFDEPTIVREALGTGDPS